MPNLAPLEILGWPGPAAPMSITSSTVITTAGQRRQHADRRKRLVSAVPIFTVGETFSGTSGALNSSTSGDYTPVGILDGLGAYELDANTVRVFANHELTAGDGYEYELSDGAGGTYTLDGARISYFDIDKTTKQIVDSGLAYNTLVDSNGDIVTDNTFQGTPFATFFDGAPGNGSQLTGLSRFCSSVLIEAEQFGAGNGLADRIYFAGEEDGSGFNSIGGAEWALDPETGTLYAVPAMGRGAWENVSEIDTGTTTHVAFILMDDTSPFDVDDFAAEGDAGDTETEAAPLYLYVGEKDSGTGGFLDRNGLENGKLYVWVSDTGETLPSEFNGAGNSLAGSWVEIDNSQNVALASEDGSTGYDEYGYPTQRTLWDRAEAVGAFGLSRPEDVAVNPADGTEVVIASTGVSSYDGGADTVGTLYTVKTDFTDINNPTATTAILYDGDEDPAQALRSPDNLDWADDGLIYVQEDRAVGGIFGPNAANPNDASIVAIDPVDGTLTRVAEINQDVTRGAVDENVASNGQQDIGDWESSGILDVSTLFGEAPGTLFLSDVQAHALDDQNRFPESQQPRLTDGDLKEGGQLAFLSNGADLGDSAELIGVVGATVPTLGSISSPDDVTISPTWASGTPTEDELDALAAEIQFEVDTLLAENPGMNKVILLAHMQRIDIELALAERLFDVDIIVAGGSNTRLFDEDDRARDGDSNQGTYPSFVTNAGGTTTAVVNTDGNYKYVGRLAIDFDADGNIIAESYDPSVSGAYATDAAGIAEAAAAAGFSSALEEDQEVGTTPEDTDAQGTVTVTAFDSVSGQLVIEGTFSGLQAENATNALFEVGAVDAEGNPVSAIHLHNAAAGSNGPIVRNFTVVDNGDGSGSYSGSFTLTSDEVASFIAGETYVNLHTTDFNSGQLRGQIDFNTLIDPEIDAITDAIQAEIVATESNVFGVSDVFLNGNRSGTFTADDPDGVRTQETNLGNLTADANLAYANQIVAEQDALGNDLGGPVVLSFKNGGGIRASIGEIVVPAGGTEAVRQPNSAVVDENGVEVKPEGGISQNDIGTTLSFNNGLVLVDITRAELIALLEGGLSALPSPDGGFPQVSGVRFSFDETQSRGLADPERRHLRRDHR